MRLSFLPRFQYMACALTQGYTQDCRDGIGGAKEIYLIEKANVTAITVTAGVVTAITKASLKRFWKYIPARDTGYGKFTLQSNVPNGIAYYQQEVGMAINKLSTNMSLELQKITKNNLLAVVKDQNGTPMLYGYQNGLDATAGDNGTGTAPGDRNGFTITLSGSEPAMPLEVDSATFAALETPGT